MRRRSLLLALPALPAGGAARAFSVRPATDSEAADIAASCKQDAGHAATLDLAIAQLHRAGVRFDEPAMRASGKCPICGCPAVRSQG